MRKEDEALHKDIIAGKNLEAIHNTIYSRGANPCATNKVGEHALHVAARHNTNPAIAKLLIGWIKENMGDVNEYVNATNPDGFTALHFSVLSEELNSEFIRELIAAGANINCESKGHKPIDLYAGQFVLVNEDMMSTVMRILNPSENRNPYAIIKDNGLEEKFQDTPVFKLLTGN